MKKIVALSVACVLGSSSGLLGANLASDSAANYANWTDGSNGGTGFSNWELLTIGNNNTNAFAGHFLAGGNSDLNFIATSTKAWGTYANDTSADNSATDTLQSAAAFRSTTGGAINVGQSLVVRMEHGNIDFAGSTNPLNVPTLGALGFAGVVLSPFPGNGADPYTPFGATSGVPAFGFRGGDSTYSIYDNASPSGRSFSTGIPFTSDGLEITFAATSASTTTVTVKNLATNATYSEVLNQSITGVTRFGLYNRNTEEANVYFNSLAVIPEPTALALLAGGTLLGLRRRK